MIREKEDRENLERIIREYVRYESEQINRRMTWVGSLQGFLFAAFGLLYTSKQTDLFVLKVVCALGFFVALLILISMSTGTYGIWKIRDEVMRKNLNIDKRMDIFGQMPGKPGRNSRLIFLSGELLICLSFMIAWGFLLGYIICYM